MKFRNSRFNGLVLSLVASLLFGGIVTPNVSAQKRIEPGTTEKPRQSKVSPDLMTLSRNAGGNAKVIVQLDPKSGASEERAADPTGPFCALAFKIVTDPFVGKLTYFRVYSGTLRAGSYVFNATRDMKERVSRILQMHAGGESPKQHSSLPADSRPVVLKL